MKEFYSEKREYFSECAAWLSVCHKIDCSFLQKCYKQVVVSLVSRQILSGLIQHMEKIFHLISSQTDTTKTFHLFFLTCCVVQYWMLSPLALEQAGRIEQNSFLFTVRRKNGIIKEKVNYRVVIGLLAQKCQALLKKMTLVRLASCYTAIFVAFCTLRPLTINPHLVRI